MGWSLFEPDEEEEDRSCDIYNYWGYEGAKLSQNGLSKWTRTRPPMKTNCFCTWHDSLNRGGGEGGVG
jgi:hypothetical protein